MNRLKMHPLAAAALAVSCVALPPPATELPDSPASVSAEEAPWDSQYRYLEPEGALDEEADPENGMDGMEQVPPEASSGHGSHAAPSAPRADVPALEQGDPHADHSTETDPKSSSGEEHTALSYVCPMHPEVVGEAPGTCPICGMALEPQPSPASEEDGR